jgi:hypothetical protein
MFAALLKLKDYDKRFAYALYSLIPVIGIAFIEDVSMFMKYPKNNVFPLITAVLLVIYHIFMYGGINRLATEVSLPKIAKAANRNKIIAVVYFAVTFVICLKLPLISSQSQYYSAPYLLFGMVWVTLTAVMVFKCYVRIAMKGDENMPKKSYYKKKPK